MHTPSDLVPFKRHVDVFVTGHVYAPNSRPVDALDVRLGVGTLRKTLRVEGDRVWLPEGKLSAALPFLKIPLRWERAAGGPGTTNPAGIPPEGQIDARGKKHTPNFFAPNAVLDQLGQVVAPVGFGPIAPHWPERQAKLHEHAPTWSHDAWTNAALPTDIDAGYFNAAPADQQIDTLTFPLHIDLEGLHSKQARLSTVLEEVVPYAKVRRQEGSEQDIRLRCDTVAIDTDNGTCSLVWRGLIALRDPREEGAVEFTLERPHAAASTVMVDVSVDGVALPFVGGVSPLAYEVSIREKRSELSGATSEPWAESKQAAVLPFGTRVVAAVEATTEPWREATQPAVPFVAGNSALARAVSPIAPHIDTGTSVPWASASPVEAIVEPREFKVEKPPQWGPIAAPEMVHTVEPAPAPPAVVEEKDPLEEYPIERCGAIAAKMACRPRAEARMVLRDEGLSFEKWQQVHEYWLEEIRDEAGRGEKKMLAVYDAAYVAAIEAERGAIGAKDYARLVLASERGKEAAVLREMRIPAEAMMRIRRVWLGKMVRDGKVALERVKR